MFIDYKEMGKRIAKRRKFLGLTQANIIEKANLNENYLSHIETARTIPSIDVLMKICVALDTTPNYLLLGTVLTDDDKWIKNLNQKVTLVPKTQRSLLLGFIDLLIELSDFD